MKIIDKITRPFWLIAEMVKMCVNQNTIVNKYPSKKKEKTK